MMNDSTNQDIEMHPAVPEELPPLTFWPLFLAVGVVFLFWGILTSLLISATGLVISGISLFGWIADMIPENEQTEKE
jgi:hypothetical protein